MITCEHYRFQNTSDKIKGIAVPSRAVALPSFANNYL